eukprot:5933822-Amphidinium_carterae.1
MGSQAIHWRQSGIFAVTSKRSETRKVLFVALRFSKLATQASTGEGAEGDGKLDDDGGVQAPKSRLGAPSGTRYSGVSDFTTIAAEIHPSSICSLTSGERGHSKGLLVWTWASSKRIQASRPSGEMMVRYGEARTLAFCEAEPGKRFQSWHFFAASERRLGPAAPPLLSYLTQVREKSAEHQTPRDQSAIVNVDSK